MTSKETEETKPKRVKFSYDKPEDYKPLYVNGAYGGMTPKGELMVHFFMEYADIPLEDDIPLDDKGRRINEETVRTIRKDVPSNTLALKREIRAGVIIPPQQIKNIATWMTDHLEKSGILVTEEEE